MIKNNLLNKLLKEKNLISRKIHQSTYFEEKEKIMNDFHAWPESWIRIHYKSYPRFPKIFLPEPRLKSIMLNKALLDRKSDRNFNSYKITKKEISQLSFFSAGITNLHETADWNKTKRSYPSAGARYPLELYLAIFQAKNISQGLFHYDVKNHALEILNKSNLIQEFYDLVGQDWIKQASVMFIITSIFQRSEIKYEKRAYRYCLLEAGHLAQNIYLESQTLNLKCCAIGGFRDAAINSILDVDENVENTLYLIVVGK